MSKYQTIPRSILPVKTDLQRIADALERIAKSLEKMEKYSLSQGR